MLLCRIHYLLLGSILLLLLGCAAAHPKMTAVTTDGAALQKFKPAFGTALYSTKVDVVGNHLSGLLLIKKMPDSSIRMVFSNEMGFKFFDFEFKANGEFKVYSVIKQMNKKSVLKTLRKDFELVLMNKMNAAEASTYIDKGMRYFAFPQVKGYNYYITDSSATNLISMQRASKRKTVVEAIMQHYVEGIPDTIGISHKTFSFTIGLKSIKR
jgi:hypothetical protein